MECPTNCGLGNWWKHFKSAALRIEVPPFYVVGELVNGARLLIPVDIGRGLEGRDRSCPYKVLMVFRSFKQIFQIRENQLAFLSREITFCLNDLKTRANTVLVFLTLYLWIYLYSPPVFVRALVIIDTHFYRGILKGQFTPWIKHRPKLFLRVFST